MLPDPKVRCPATGFAKSCRAIVTRHECPKFVKIAGVDRNTGAEVHQFGCVDSFLPMLLMENSYQQRGTAASVDKVANEVRALHGDVVAINEAASAVAPRARTLDHAAPAPKALPKQQ